MNKNLVIISGAGPEAGLLLLQQIIALCQHYGCKNDCDFPYIKLLNFPFAEMLLEDNNEIIRAQLKDLIETECIDCDYWTIACNTLHLYLPTHEDPRCIHIIKETQKKVDTLPLILGSGTSFHQKLHQQFFDCLYPTQEHQHVLNSVIDQILSGQIDREQTVLLEKMTSSYPTHLIVLGCTEFSVLHSKYPFKSPVLDSSELVAQAFCHTYFKEK